MMRTKQLRENVKYQFGNWACTELDSWNSPVYFFLANEENKEMTIRICRHRF